MKTWQTLIRREFWEHRGLFLAPSIVALFLIGIAVFGNAGVRFNGRRHWPMGEGWDVPGSALVATAIGVGSIILMLTIVMVFGYLLDSLYSERKDRSVLFWRSLPVTDRDTVLAKFVVGMVVAPLLSFVVFVVAHGIISAIVLMRAVQIEGAIVELWDWGRWSSAVGGIFVRMVLVLLWYAPLAAWLMLASAIARRSPFLYALLPPLAVVTVETLVFDSSVVRRYLMERFQIHAPLADGVLQDPQLWLGLAATAIMLAIAIRMRRYRDDA